ncbi:MAG: SprT-like domain-containing protein [Chthoniobacterales bacterium]|nr:SprT-like domain-containing protein [Chthoniobacterales bacterium]
MPARAFQSGAEETVDSLGREARGWALRFGLPVLAARVTLRWHAPLRTTAGVARVQNSLILLNPRLLVFPGELTRTFLHELAHLVAHARHPRRRIAPHGREWLAACVDLGLPGEKRCHALPLASPRRVARRFLYHCPHCRREIARVRPFRRAEACRQCCRAQAHGRYDKRFRFDAGPAPSKANSATQAELFRL